MAQCGAIAKGYSTRIDERCVKIVECGAGRGRESSRVERSKGRHVGEITEGL